MKEKRYRLTKELTGVELIMLLDAARVTFSESVVNKMPNKKKFEEVKQWKDY